MHFGCCVLQQGLPYYVEVADGSTILVGLVPAALREFRLRKSEKLRIPRKSSGLADY